MVREKYAVEFGIFSQAEIDHSNFGYAVYNQKTDAASLISPKPMFKAFFDNRVYEESGLDVISFMKLPENWREDIVAAIKDSLRDRHPSVPKGMEHLVNPER